MRRLALVLATGLTLACQPPPAPAEREGASPSASAAATNESSTPSGCTREALHAELIRYCDYDLGVPPLELAHVGWTADSYHPLGTRVITLDAHGLTDPEGGETVSIAAWLADPPRRLPEPGEMVFAIAAGLPATDVAELLTGLGAAGRQRIRVLVHPRNNQPIPQPRDAELLASMRASLPDDHHQRVGFVAQRVHSHAATCPGLGGVFPQLTGVSPGERCAKLAELASQAVAGCGCPQLDGVMTTFYALTIGFEAPRGRAVAVELQLDPNHAQPVTIEAGQTWAQLAAALLTSPEPRALWLTKPH